MIASLQESLAVHSMIQSALVGHTINLFSHSESELQKWCKSALLLFGYNGISGNAFWHAFEPVHVNAGVIDVSVGHINDASAHE